VSDGTPRGVVRALAAGIVGAFFLQIVFVAKAEEPYPGLMMPRFAWAGPPKGDPISVNRPEIVFTYADGATRAVTQTELLEHVPIGHHGGIMENLLSPLPDPPVTARAQPGKYEPPVWLFPGYHLARVSRTTPEHGASLEDWLRRRASAFYSAAPPVRCTVTWYRETHSSGEDGRSPNRVVERTPGGRFEVDLN